MNYFNETMKKKSSINDDDDDTQLIFAGHLLIVFYCLIFIFGFLGKYLKNKRNLSNTFFLFR